MLREGGEWSTKVEGGCIVSLIFFRHLCEVEEIIKCPAKSGIGMCGGIKKKKRKRVGGIRVVVRPRCCLWERENERGGRQRRD